MMSLLLRSLCSQVSLARALCQADRCRDRHAHKERGEQVSSPPPRRRRCMLETIRHGPQSSMQTRKGGAVRCLSWSRRKGVQAGKRWLASTEEWAGAESKSDRKESKDLPFRGRGILGSGVQRQIRSCVVVVSMGRGRWWPPPPGPPAAELLVAVVGVFRVRSSIRGSLGLRRCC